MRPKRHLQLSYLCVLDLERCCLVCCLLCTLVGLNLQSLIQGQQLLLEERSFDLAPLNQLKKLQNAKKHIFAYDVAKVSRFEVGGSLLSNSLPDDFWQKIG